jgi:spore coat polysaccharide biosynthesis protein SpsF (cytidylyltransferase family)
MTSSRFPGKVLAPFRGRPVLAHVIDGIAEALDTSRIIIATSTEASDDPIAVYAWDLGIQVFRGPLDNVFRRLQLCVEEHQCDWFFRVCADSPLLDPRLLSRMLGLVAPDVDLVTNIFPRTFPKGRSLELLFAPTFLRIDADRLSDVQREHVTRVYYDKPGEFHIVNVFSADPAEARLNLAVDTVEDLLALEKA